MFIEEQVNLTFDAKTSTIDLNANKSFLAKNLIINYNNGNLEILMGDQLEQIQDKFIELNFPNIYNLVILFKHRLNGGYINNILTLKSIMNHYDNCIQGNFFVIRFSLSKCMLMGLGTKWTLLHECSLGGIQKILESCLTMSNALSVMACHLYDSTHYNVMTIVICNMQSKDTKAQYIMCPKLNNTMVKHGHFKPNFKKIVG